MTDYQHYIKLQNSFRELRKERDKLEKTNLYLLKELAQIAGGTGEYNLDPLKHASNCIVNMKEIAKQAINKSKGN